MLFLDNCSVQLTLLHCLYLIDKITKADADGRQRRVEYVADEAGFRAKVQTNEVGTKSENSADVEVLAAPPTREQLVYQAPAVQQQQTVAVQPARAVSQQVVAAPQAARYQYVQQPYGYGYYPSNGYQYGSGYYNQPSYAYPGYGAYGNGVYGGYGTGVYTGYGTGPYGSYNNHLPSQYYKSVGASTVGAQAVQGARYVPVNSQYRGYQTVGVPATQGAYYQTVGVQPAQARSSSYQGSSNYVVLNKRESEAAPAEAQKKA